MKPGIPGISRSGISALEKICLAGFLFVVVIGSQAVYDAVQAPSLTGASSATSPEFMRVFDGGFHSTFGSFAWISTMPEVLGVYFQGNMQYLRDLDFVNGVDPKLSYPYAFSVITLPAIVRLPDRNAIATAIGERGLANADPDWRIPYYLAAHEYLDMKDTAAALTYYDIAAHTPGIPAYAERFALNFSLLPDDRAKVMSLWASIYETTNDQALKERAAAYIARLQIFNYLESAAQAYKDRYGIFPKTLGNLVAKGIIKQIPVDPFGFTYAIDASGKVGIDPTELPSYLK